MRDISVKDKTGWQEYASKDQDGKDSFSRFFEPLAQYATPAMVSDMIPNQTLYLARKKVAVKNAPET